MSGEQTMKILSVAIVMFSLSISSAFADNSKSASEYDGDPLPTVDRAQANNCDVTNLTVKAADLCLTAIGSPIPGAVANAASREPSNQQRGPNPNTPPVQFPDGR